MKIDWKEKLTSRKFWVAVAGVVAPLLLAFGVSNDTVTQVTSIIMAGASVVTYVFAESKIDANRKDE